MMDRTPNHVDVSKNSGTPKSSILIWFSNIKHPFWGTPIFGNTHVVLQYKGTYYKGLIKGSFLVPYESNKLYISWLIMVDISWPAWIFPADLPFFNLNGGQNRGLFILYTGGGGLYYIQYDPILYYSL